MSHKNVLSLNTGGGATIETLSGENGPHTPPNGHNFNFSGSIAGGAAANGAIEFITPGGPGHNENGQMDAKVLVDGTTIEINSSNELQVVGGPGIQIIDGDTGSITGSTVTIYANNAAQNAGSTVLFANSGTVSTLNVSDGNSNTIIGNSAGNATISGNTNVGLGRGILRHLTSGSQNSAFGNATQANITSGQNNSSLGFQALNFLVTGSNNIAIGSLAGTFFTGAESSNILIGNGIGVLGDNNTIRIGSQGSGAGQQNTCYIAGINGVTLGGTPLSVVIDSTSGQLGVTSASAGVTIDGDTGSATGSTITFNATPTAGSSTSFSASGTTVALNLTDSNANTILGLNAGNGSISGTGNTGLGSLVFQGLGSAINCTAMGYSALNGLGGNEGCTAVGYNAILAMFGQRNTAVGEFSLGSASGASGAYNTCLGYNTGVHLTSGSENLLMGTAGTVGSGSQYTSSESSNILLNHAGVTGESNTMRLGTTGSGGGQVSKCFIAGVLGATSSSPVALMIDSSTGQVTAGSSSPFTSINIQTFTSSGTYTPTSGMTYCTIECWGGGGGSGGAEQNGGTGFTGTGGGGAGGYSRKTASAATIGASQSVTIGAAGAAGTLHSGNGGNGGATSVGSICVANGGSGSVGTTAPSNGAGGAGGTPGTGDIAAYGMNGSNGISTATVATITALPGNGGSTLVGSGGLGAIAPNTSGGAPLGFGSGGGGSQAQTIAQPGVAGAPGYVIITEYIG